MREFLFISLCIPLLIQAMSVEAGWFGTDFSAEVVVGTTESKEKRGNMYVGAGRVRTEIGMGEQQLIEIIDPAKGVAWVLDVGSKSYQERIVPKVTATTVTQSPCEGVAGAECRALPEETINGRRCNKWMLRFNGKERVQWNDALHGFPVQVVESGQVVMAMVFIAEETLNGRHVERWRALQHTEGRVTETEQWYDPQLNIAIRQQEKNGSFRELRNIRLGPQADALFELPKGYSSQKAVAR